MHLLLVRTQISYSAWNLLRTKRCWAEDKFVHADIKRTVTLWSYNAIFSRIIQLPLRANANANCVLSFYVCFCNCLVSFCSFIIFHFIVLISSCNLVTSIQHKGLNPCLFTSLSSDVCVWQWCEQDVRCRRLQLTDLLISPMQRCTKVPMMLNSIRQHTQDADERQQLANSLDKLEESLSKPQRNRAMLRIVELILTCICDDQLFQQKSGTQSSIVRMSSRAFPAIAYDLHSSNL